MTVLVLAPHGDDAELGMGATIARYVRSGVKVVHAVCTVSGYTSSSGVKIDALERASEFLEACAVLGSEGRVYGFVDNRLAESGEALVRMIDDLIADVRPGEVYTCLPWFNADHTALYEATLAAMRRDTRASFWAYELPDQGLGYQMPQHGWQYRDVSLADMNAKSVALRRYNSQGLGAKRGAVSVTGASLLAETRGREVYCEFAERFLLLRGLG